MRHVYRTMNLDITDTAPGGKQPVGLLLIYDDGNLLGAAKRRGRGRKPGNFTRAICGLRLAIAYRRHGGGAIGHGACIREESC